MQNTSRKYCKMENEKIGKILLISISVIVFGESGNGEREKERERMRERELERKRDEAWERKSRKLEGDLICQWNDIK